MLNTSITPKSLISQGKDIEEIRKAQLIRFYNYLLNHTVTCSMASAELQIPQKCLTRYKRKLEMAGLLWGVFQGYCKYTGFKAHYLTTNPLLASKPIQPEIEFPK